jgi:hypothetical protein
MMTTTTATSSAIDALQAGGGAGGGGGGCGGGSDGEIDLEDLSAPSGSSNMTSTLANGSDREMVTKLQVIDSDSDSSTPYINLSFLFFSSFFFF